jgi:hypothetical protein
LGIAGTLRFSTETIGKVQVPYEANTRREPVPMLLHAAAPPRVPPPAYATAVVIVCLHAALLLDRDGFRS